MPSKAPFRFKQFDIFHHLCAHPVGTDGVLLGAWAQCEGQQILDVGCGSGLISLMLAQRFPDNQITGIELDAASAQQCQTNFENSPFAKRLKLIQGDFLNYRFNGQFDLIVSNPPFYQAGFESGNTQRDRARQEKFLPQSNFLERAAALLKPGGKVALILPGNEAQQFLEKATDRNLHPSRILRVRGKAGIPPNRWLFELSRKPIATQESEMILRNEDGSYTDQYRQLTKDFHPHFENTLAAVETRIFIHLGPGKTGSSAIQKAFLAQQKWLRAKGYFYPTHAVDDNGISSGHRKKLLSRTGNDLKIDGAKISKLKAEVKRSGCHSMILSCEALISYMDELREFFPNAVFIAYLRDPIRLEESLYNQRVKRHRFTELFKIKNGKPNFGVLRLLERHFNKFGTEKFQLRLYHKSLFCHQSILCDFAEAVGIANFPEPANLEVVNSKYSHPALLFKRRLNHWSLGEYDMEELDKVLQQHSDPKNYSLIPPEEYSQVRERVQQELKAFFEAHAIEGQQFLDLLRSEDQEPGQSQELSDLELQQMLNFLKNENPALLNRLISISTRQNSGDPIQKQLSSRRVNVLQLLRYQALKVAEVLSKRIKKNTQFLSH